MGFTFEQIQALHDMGFTADQITNIATTSAETIPADQTGKDSGEATATSPDPVILEESEPVENPVETVENSGTNALAELQEEIKALRASIQAQNIKTQSMEVISAEDKLESAMAEFIRPSYNENERK